MASSLTWHHKLVQNGSLKHTYFTIFTFYYLSSLLHTFVFRRLSSLPASDDNFFIKLDFNILRIDFSASSGARGNYLSRHSKLYTSAPRCYRVRVKAIGYLKMYLKCANPACLLTPLASQSKDGAGR
jgi:hypothetical protein